MTMPPIRPRIATRAKGMRNQVGSSVVSAPIGSPPIASDRDSSAEPTRRIPKKTRMTVGSAAPTVVHPTTPFVEASRGR